MKRVYESPVMMLEGFEANEYVAACWDITCLGFLETNYYYENNGKIGDHLSTHNCGNTYMNVSDPEITKDTVFLRAGNSKNIVDGSGKPITKYDDCYNVDLRQSSRPNAS